MNDDALPQSEEEQACIAKLKAETELLQAQIARLTRENDEVDKEAALLSDKAAKEAALLSFQLKAAERDDKTASNAASLLSARYLFHPNFTLVAKSVVAGLVSVGTLIGIYFILYQPVTDAVRTVTEKQGKVATAEAQLAKVKTDFEAQKNVALGSRLKATQAKLEATEAKLGERDKKLAEREVLLKENRATLAALRADQELIVEDLNKEYAKLQQKLKSPVPQPAEGTPKTIKLRSQPRLISSEDLVNDIKSKGLNLPSKNVFGTIQNSYKTIENGASVVDQTTKLIWEQSGSKRLLTYSEAVNYVIDLNNRDYAGKKIWRIPTMEELISLVEEGRRNGSLYIDPVFDGAQHRIISADKSGLDRRWGLVFYSTTLYLVGVEFPYFVRAVRSLDDT